ncbi:MAG: hypothetical protein KAG94_05210 [Clostridiales bacterium]|nr:hypothetical protein [Clostridiales bacterium]
MEFITLPISIKKTFMQGVAYTKYNDINTLYGVLAEGECATFVVIDLDKKLIVKTHELEGATGSWTVSIASDNRVYIGSYTNGGLYRYDPIKQQTDMVIENIPGVKFIFDLQADNDNNIYGGTWPNCAVFKYNGKDERLEFVKEKIVETEDYVRTLALNVENKKIYAGVSTHAHLIELDEKTGIKRDLLKAELHGEPFCNIIGIKQQKLALFLQNTKQLLFIDLTTDEIINRKKLENISSVIPKDSNSNNFDYYRSQDGLVIADFLNNDFYLLPTSDNVIMLGGFSYDDGTKILFTEFEGQIHLYDIETGSSEEIKVLMPKKNIELRQIHEYKNKLYGGGYLRGGTFIYDIENDKSVQLDGVGQSESLLAYNDKLYIGKYPGADIFEYDLLKDWDDKNPKKLFSLKDKFNQDRPFAMEIYDEQLFIGTIPNYGSTEGSLTICRLIDKKYTVLENFIDNQSIVSLKAKDGILYGGTTVCGGLGSYTLHESGRLFAYDILKKEIIFSIEPVKGRKNIGGLLIDDNLLFGCADTTLFIIDLTTGKKIFEQFVCVHNPEKDYKWEISFIKKGKAGLYYIVTGNRLFSFDLKQQILAPIMKKKVNLLQIDSEGHLYMQYLDNVRNIIKSVETV